MARGGTLRLSSFSVVVVVVSPPTLRARPPRPYRYGPESKVQHPSPLARAAALALLTEACLLLFWSVATLLCPPFLLYNL